MQLQRQWRQRRQRRHRAQAHTLVSDGGFGGGQAPDAPSVTALDSGPCLPFPRRDAISPPSPSVARFRFTQRAPDAAPVALAAGAPLVGTPLSIDSTQPGREQKWRTHAASALPCAAARSAPTPSVTATPAAVLGRARASARIAASPNTA